MFLSCETPEQRSFEHHLYRAWDFVFQIWSLTLISNQAFLGCGPQHPFLHRVPGALNVLQYCLPDFVLLLSDVIFPNSASEQAGSTSQAFLVAEVKALPDPNWTSKAGMKRAKAIITHAYGQVANQARLAFKQHGPKLQTLHALVLCGPWWHVYVFENSNQTSPNLSIRRK